MKLDMFTSSVGVSVQSSCHQQEPPLSKEDYLFSAKYVTSQISKYKRNSQTTVQTTVLDWVHYVEH